jgi:hypothetical protein
MGRRERQRSFIALLELRCDLGKVFGVDEHPFDELCHFLSGFGKTEQAFAAPHENFDPKFFFKIADVFANARLRRVESVGRIGEIELVANGLSDDPKLLKIHFAKASNVSRRKHRQYGMSHRPPSVALVITERALSQPLLHNQE